MIAAHNGRLIKTTGGRLLVDFASVVALRFASEARVSMAERCTTAPTDGRRITGE
jgi:hypothetical protein